MNEDKFMIQARRCKRCGRLLTSREAVEKGYGCQCAAKIRTEEEARQPIKGQLNIFDFIKEEEQTCKQPQEKQQEHPQ